MRKILLLMGCMLMQWASAQIIQRKALQENEVLNFTYTLSSDTLKGFFSISENFTGKVKLQNAVCNVPYRFSKNSLQISGDKIPPVFTATFSFVLLDENVSVQGVFRAENFGKNALEMPLENITVEKPRVLAQAEKKVEKVKPVDTATSQTQPVLTDKNLPEKPISNEPGSPAEIRFCVQLAASSVPMDKMKLQETAGLGLSVEEEHIGPYYKYTIGSEKSLQAAQKILDRLPGTRFKKPFIVAYRQKQRISVQEALSEINRQAR